jgi:membrane-bound lytic murein transglycosylase A
VAIKDNNGNLLKNIWVNYRAQNGRPYVAIGKILKEEGVDRSYLTLQGLRRYFRERPEEMDRIFPMNPSYIFFRKADEGPFGSTGFRLIAGHSAALDNRYYPSGVFGLTQYMQPEKVDQEVDHWEEKSRFVFHHDSGGAIKGPGRMDVFWGSGDFAETAAGGSAHYGDLFFGIVR